MKWTVFVAASRLFGESITYDFECSKRHAVLSQDRHFIEIIGVYICILRVLNSTKVFNSENRVNLLNPY